jgi:hypothetical protein
VNGLVSASYVGNFNAPPSGTNQFRVFDTRSDTFALDVAELVVQRSVSAPGDAGFRIDLTFGSLVPKVTAAAGLFRDENGVAGSFDLQQAYFSYIAPAGRGLRIDAGKFTTYLGYEVIEGYDGYNDNHSHSFLFGYAQPITHTGLRVSYPFSGAVSAQAYLVNGWDNAVDNNTGKSIGAQLTLTPSPRLSVLLNYLGGPEQASESSKPSTAAASIHELAMLLPSPIHATFLPAMPPNSCRTVSRSARIWQGCCRSVRPLITGMSAWRANSSMSA